MTTKIAIVTAGIGCNVVESLARRGIDTPAARLWADNRRVNAHRIEVGAAW